MSKGGNKLNRVEAGKCITNAEEAIENILSIGQKVTNSIENLNNGYMGPSGSNISSIYESYYTTLNACLKNFATGFVDPNNKLVEQINDGAQNDEVHPSVTTHPYPSSFSVQTSNDESGITDFAITVDAVNQLNGDIQSFVDSTDALVSEYKILWGLAMQANNTNLASSAHDAKAQVDAFIENLANGFQECNSKFITDVQSQQSESSNDYNVAMDAIGVMKNSFNAVDFSVLSSNFDVPTASSLYSHTSASVTPFH